MVMNLLCKLGLHSYNILSIYNIDAVHSALYINIYMIKRFDRTLSYIDHSRYKVCKKCKKCYRQKQLSQDTLFVSNYGYSSWKKCSIKSVYRFLYLIPDLEKIEDLV